MGRGLSVRRVALLAAVVVSMVVAIPMRSVGHTPDQSGTNWAAWSWTCYGGNGFTQSSGDCWRHHTNADARIWRQSATLNSGGTWYNHFWNGHNQWDQSYGHAFNVLVETSDTSNNTNIRTVTGHPCGNSTYAGCCSCNTFTTSGSHHHISEGPSFIELRENTSVDRAALVAHELGHWVGLGHSAETDTTMTNRVNPAAEHRDLADEDRAGRSEIYGHTHNFW